MLLVCPPSRKRNPVAFIWGALFVGTLMLAFGSGAIVASRLATTQHLKTFGLTTESARLYQRAARILDRMQRVTQFDGDLCADILSPTTKTLVAEWLADYRKQIERV